MKQLRIAVIIAVIVAGCKKEYTCECIAESGTLHHTVTVTAATRSKATYQCKRFNGAPPGGLVFEGSCDLKK
jgi:hypothetical protein